MSWAIAKACGAFTYMHICITKLTSQLGLIDPVGGSPRSPAVSTKKADNLLLLVLGADHAVPLW